MWDFSVESSVSIFEYIYDNYNRLVLEGSPETTVIIYEFGDNITSLVSRIKTIRSIGGFSLVEAKRLVDKNSFNGEPIKVSTPIGMSEVLTRVGMTVKVLRVLPDKFFEI